MSITCDSPHAWSYLSPREPFLLAYDEMPVTVSPSGMTDLVGMLLSKHAITPIAETQPISHCLPPPACVIAANYCEL